MKKEILDQIASIILIIIFLLVFLGILIGIAYYAIMNFSLASVIGCAVAAIIPGLIPYSGLCAAIQYIKETYFNKWHPETKQQIKGPW